MIDDTESVSPPRSAKFVIDPSPDNTSADATIEMKTTGSLARFVVTADLRIDRAEQRVARLFFIEQGGHILFEPSGLLKGPQGTYRALAAVANGRWVALRIEVRTDVTPAIANFTVDGTSTGDFELGSGWAPGPISMRFGISEAAALTTGWIVRWDNIVLRQL
jgi:hypothetical protein